MSKPSAGLHFSRRAFLGAVTVGALASSGMARSFAANKPPKVGFILPDYEQLRWRNADQRFFEEEAHKLGLETFIQVSNNSESLQANQVENLITRGIDALVLAPVNGKSSVSLVRKARAANVPVINYNYIIPGSDSAAYIGRDAQEMGAKIAQAAIEARPTGNYVLIFGDEGTSVALDTAKGNLSVIQPQVTAGKIRIVSQQYQKSWSAQAARAQVENALTQTSNDIAAVLCNNDGMAYGAIQALQAQGLAGKVFVTGVDAEPRAQQLIKDGLLGLSNFTAFDVMGRKAADAAHALATGASVGTDATQNNGFKDVPWIKAPNFNVTGENLAQAAADYSWWFDKSKLGL